MNATFGCPFCGHEVADGLFGEDEERMQPTQAAIDHVRRHIGNTGGKGAVNPYAPTTQQDRAEMMELKR